MIEHKEPMSGPQIAKQLGVSRQFVSMQLRKAMMKLYYKVIREKLAETPAEAVFVLMKILNVHNSPMEEVASFIGLFEKHIIDEVKNELTNDRAKLYN